MNNDWYRQQEWTPVVSTEFEKRLSRSRGQKSEYLRIQALTLADTLKPELAGPAVDLAKRFLELKSEGIGVAQMYATIAKAFSTLGNIAAANDAYKCAVDAESKWPNSRGYHYLDFAWFVATHKLTDQYSSALAAMDRNKQDQDFIFPANQYRYFGALALISSEGGDKETAKRMAKNALIAASKEKGPFKRLPWAGIVKRESDEIRVRLKQLAG